MGISLDGLASGLDTTALIDALMDVHAIPRTLLQKTSIDRGGIIAQLQKLNTSLQELASGAADAAKSDSLAVFTGTASGEGTSVRVGAEAGPVSAEIIVDRLATSHTVVTAAMNVWPDDPATFTIERGDGTLVELTADSTSPADIARAINGADAGVHATVVSAGTDAAGDPLYRLQLIAEASGADGAFRVLRGSADAVTAGTASDVAAAPGAAIVTAGADAQVRLWAGTAAEQQVTSSSNTFTDLFPGVDVTVGAASATPVRIEVAVDQDTRTTTAEDFITRIAALLTGIDKGSTATVTEGQPTTLGVFTGDSTVRALRQALTQAVQYPIDGVSPSSIGISFDKHGALQFDSDAFVAALAKDPDAVTAMFTGIAARVEQVAQTYSDRHEGLLTSRITGQEREVTMLDEQIERWDLRLAQRRATLERTYARLETMLAQFQSQSQYLTSQLAGLPSFSSGSGS